MRVKNSFKWKSNTGICMRFRVQSFPGTAHGFKQHCRDSKTYGRRLSVNGWLDMTTVYRRNAHKHRPNRPWLFENWEQNLNQLQTQTRTFWMDCWPVWPEGKPSPSFFSCIVFGCRGSWPWYLVGSTTTTAHIHRCLVQSGKDKIVHRHISIGFVIANRRISLVRHDEIPGQQEFLFRFYFGEWPHINVWDSSAQAQPVQATCIDIFRIWRKLSGDS